MGGGWGGERRKSGVIFISGPGRGGRNIERCRADRRVLITSLTVRTVRTDQTWADSGDDVDAHLGVATHRQNRQGRPGLETTRSGLLTGRAGFETSATSSQGAERGADNGKEDRLSGSRRHISASCGVLHSCSVLANVFYRKGMRGYL